MQLEPGKRYGMEKHGVVLVHKFITGAWCPYDEEIVLVFESVETGRRRQFSAQDFKAPDAISIKKIEDE